MSFQIGTLCGKIAVMASIDNRDDARLLVKLIKAYTVNLPTEKQLNATKKKAEKEAILFNEEADKFKG
jgi:hypothetical protein